VTGLALALIVAAAFIHAAWNLLAKRASGNVAFTWLFAVWSVALYAPLAAAVIFWRQTQIGLTEVGFMVGSAVLHTAYFLLLNLGYRFGDLSLIYPLARGTGPLLSCTAAIVFLGERPTALALLGALLITAGVVTLTGSLQHWREPGARRAVVYALLTGTFIAAYTLLDKQAVSKFSIAPLLLDWGANVGRAFLLVPLALARWERVRAEWNRHRFEVLGVALLAPLSYILVLTALAFTPVSYVAPAREVSIVIGAAMGTGLLGEGEVWRRLSAAAAPAAGVIALAAG
jgi:uncharacterized membrane protein